MGALEARRSENIHVHLRMMQCLKHWYFCCTAVRNHTVLRWVEIARQLQ